MRSKQRERERGRVSQDVTEAMHLEMRTSEPTGRIVLGTSATCLCQRLSDFGGDWPSLDPSMLLLLLLLPV